MKSCKPGGAVVYSTCTLSPSQNDGIVQAALETVWRETDMKVSVENLSWITSSFTDTFRFYEGCRYGQLVIPCLEANYGPMYFCKINKHKHDNVEEQETDEED